MASIKLEDISMSYDDHQALKDVNLEIREAEFTCILGPPGAGKTTLLRVIAGIEELNSGKILLNGTDISKLPPNKRNLSMIFQNFALYPNMNVYKNIGNPLTLAKVPKTEKDKKIKEVADLLKISDLLDREIWQLSGGEQQRVAIARSFVRHADAFLLDEPLVNLDYKIREDMRAEFKRLCRELNYTIIYATPDPLDAFSMSDNLAVLDKGQILQKGEVKNIYDNPKNAIVGLYLGAPPMNVMDGIVSREGNKYYINADDFKIDVTPLKKSLDGAGEKIKFGIRPEHLLMTSQAKGMITGKIFLEERVGSDIIVHTHVGSKLIKVFMPYSAKYTPGKVGQEIYLLLDINRLYVFNEDGTKLIKGL